MIIRALIDTATVVEPFGLVSGLSDMRSPSTVPNVLWNVRVGALALSDLAECSPSFRRHLDAPRYCRGTDDRAGRIVPEDCKSGMLAR